MYGTNCPSYRSIGVAEIRGGPMAPQIYGMVFFEDIPGGVWVSATITGLPPFQPASDGKAPIGPHGFHIHEKGDCSVGDPVNPFQATGSHFNPTHQPHGNHAGDFPVLFSNRGLAQIAFFTDKFAVADIVGRSVVIHQNPDDFRTEPAGDSGKRLACGVISFYNYH